MIKPGLCSVSFKQKEIHEVIALVKETKLQAIEWIGNVHVPPGDIESAEKAGILTREAGLEVAAYGSLFRLGTEMDFTPHLQSAISLKTNQMRIWAGISGKSSCEYTKEERKTLVFEAKEACKRAAEHGITLSAECHDGSLTDCVESQLLFLEEVNEPNLKTYWQELLTLPTDIHIPSLAAVLNSGNLSNIHVYNYNIFENGRERLLISDGFQKWKQRFELLKDDSTDRYALIEFVKDNSVDSFFSDAKTICSLCEIANK